MSSLIVRAELIGILEAVSTSKGKDVHSCTTEKLDVKWSSRMCFGNRLYMKSLSVESGRSLWNNFLYWFVQLPA